jgi:hypothetical protein
MRKIITSMLLTSLLFADVYSDIAITIGHNEFDDPEFLKSHKEFYGVRAGFYPSEAYGIQVGYEIANDANCQKLNLKRVYVNGVTQLEINEAIDIYGLATVGHESSNIHRFKPSQAFIGAGVGAKYHMSSNINGFLETRILQKLESKDTDVITSIGLSYTLDDLSTLGSDY